MWLKESHGSWGWKDNVGVTVDSSSKKQFCWWKELHKVSIPLFLFFNSIFQMNDTSIM